MRCPYCSSIDNKVVDSRMGKEGDSIRRRRECLQCEGRFTTYERVEEVLPSVIKKDGRREPYDRVKILNGLKKACEKRPISMDILEKAVRLGWQLTGRRQFAFFAGLITILMPDLYSYSNQVVSEMPNFFFGLLFCTLFLSAMEKLSKGWLIAALLAGSFSVLLRSENATALVLGVAFLLMKVVWEWKKQRSVGTEPQHLPHKTLTNLWQLGLAILIASVPLLAWSAHNDRLYGFFGISDYGGAVLYDGWIYFGESSRIHITDQDSPAVQNINAVYQSKTTKITDVPTPWMVYSALVEHGYTSEQACSLLGRAAIDSIRKDMPLTWKLLAVKIRKGFEPIFWPPQTLPLHGEKLPFGSIKSEYFDQETAPIPALIPLQLTLHNMSAMLYRHVYPTWVWICLGMLLLCLYRRPFFTWVPIVVITANNVFLPTILAASAWRYVLSGFILMQIFALAGLQSLAAFIPYCLQPLLRRSENLK